MKALVYDAYGPPEGLRVEDVEPPTAKAGEVRVRVHAAALNSWDWDWLVGKALIRPMAPLRPKFRILGCDVAGVVDEVGAGVTDLAVGDAVLGDISGAGWGAFAEQVRAPADVLVKKPLDMSFEQAAALPQAGVLALQGLREGGGPRPGRRILINGAGGGVGTFALALAQTEGARVTCVDRAEKQDFLRDLGADEVIDYEAKDVMATAARFDCILDVVGTRSVLEWRRLLTPQGTYVMIGGTIPRLLQVVTVGKMLSRAEGPTLGILMHRPNREDLEQLVARFEAGVLTPVIDRVYSLAEAPEAFRALGEGRVRGKAVLRVAASPAGDPIR